MHMMLEHGVYVFVPTLTMYTGNTYVLSFLRYSFQEWEI